MLVYTILHTRNFLNPQTSTVNPLIRNLYSIAIHTLQTHFRTYLKSFQLKMGTFAMFDDGSAITLLEEVIADHLGLKGKQFPLTIQW